MRSSHTTKIEKVLAAEDERIAAQRTARGVDQQPTVGLALSSGGMRSSSFALGVLQALERGELLRRVDYLSTVSGGGYTGSALTWFRRNGDTRFPFGVRGLGLRPAANGRASWILGYLRQRASLLSPAGDGDARKDGGRGSDLGARSRASVLPIAYAGLVVRSIFLSMFVYGAMLVFLFTGVELADRIVGLLHPVLAGIYPSPTWDVLVAGLNALLLVALALLVFLGVAWILHPFAAFVMRRWSSRRPSDKRETNRAYTVGLWAQSKTGSVLFWALAAVTLGSVPLISERAISLGWLPDRWALGGLAFASLVAGALLGVSIFRSRRPREAGERSLRGALGRLREISAALLMLYGLLVLSHTIALGLLNSRAVISGVVLLIVGLAAARLANLNQMNISRMYRDRLMEAFLPGNSALEHHQWRPAFDANVATLDSMCGPDTLGPYHLINTHLVTPESRRTRFRSRGGDSFVLSPLYCGSDATGWRRTDEWLEGRLTLATAMAASGPTTRSAVALADGGRRRTRLIDGTMFALGLRLGFWTRNPDPNSGGDRDVAPNYFDPGLLRGVLRRGLHEGARYIELSDGGNFDALGLYELLRRRVEVIVAADATDGQRFSFDALANVVERARVDFGVEIEFSDPEFGLADLVPQPPEGPSTALPTVAKRGFAVGSIRYADTEGEVEKWGALLLVKATQIAEVPPDVLGYALRNVEFPHDSAEEEETSEARIEAYRELGYRITKQLLEENTRRSKQGARVDPGNGVRRGPWL